MRAKHPRAGRVVMFPKNNRPFAVTCSAPPAQLVWRARSTASMLLVPSAKFVTRELFVVSWFDTEPARAWFVSVSVSSSA